MIQYQDASVLKALTLGKATEYSNKYDASLLQPVPRSLNRDDLCLSKDSLPFTGEDVWYGYELSWLNNKGKPQVAVAEFRIPCTSENLVESKSFKLYLNSFNQSQFSDWHQVEALLTKDLSATANAPVQVTLFQVDQCDALEIPTIVAQNIDEIDVEISQYDYSPELLDDSKVTNKEKAEEYLVSHLLKSNCLITNQPDWASVFIRYKGEKVNHEKLLRYLISFREHNEFHEQCVERIFCDLQKYYQFEELSVFARYTRRGGLDINPFRSLTEAKAPIARTLRQ